MRERGSALIWSKSGLVASRVSLNAWTSLSVGDRHDDVVRLLDRLRDLLLGRLQVRVERLLADQVDILALQLRLDFLPAQVVADPGPRDLQPLPRRDRQDHGVAVDSGTIRSGRLIEEPPGLGARVARRGCRFGTEHGVMKIAVVGDVVRLVRQVMDLDLVALARRARRQTLERLDRS